METINNYKELWSAVLLNAMDDLSEKVHPWMRQARKYEVRRNKRYAKLWFNKKDTEDKIGSFLWICSFLKLDQEAVIKRIFNMDDFNVYGVEYETD